MHKKYIVPAVSSNKSIIWWYERHMYRDTRSNYVIINPAQIYETMIDVTDTLPELDEYQHIGIY